MVSTFMDYRVARMVSTLAFVLVPSVILAQQDRIAGSVDPFRRVTLKGNIHPQADARVDAGAIDPSLKLDHVMVMLKRSTAQQADLDQLLVEQQDRSSKNYHSWLTPEQFGDRFGLSPNDIGRVVSWLQSEGLAVDEISRAHNWIWFSGTAGQVQAALRTELRRYNVNGESHFANSTEPSLPAALESLVMGISGLDDFHPQPARSRRVLLSSEKISASVNPRYTNSDYHYMTPDDFGTIYNLWPLYNSGYNGAGQRIVVAGQSAVNLSDIQAFRAIYGLPKNDPQLVPVPHSAVAGKNVAMGEADLDIEWAGAVARNANIIYVYSTDVLRISVPYAIDQNLAPIITYSFGLCEEQTPNALMVIVRSWAQQANAQGITWLAASADSGAAGCDSAFDPDAPEASMGLGVSFPASLPEVTAVGGTQFDEMGGTYWAPFNSNTLASALSYIPEKAWNESDASGLAAGGGGLSKVFTKPLWQSGPGVPSVNLRAVPDLSLSAADHDGYGIVSGGLFFRDSGTSTATPSLAGILAVVNQYQELNGTESRSGQGNINPTLYRLAQNTSSVFHDITAGDNIVPCTAGTPDCVNGKLGYSAGPGFDFATGLGSVDAFNLAVNLATQWSTPTISLLSPASVTLGGGNFTLAVTGTGFDPGSVVQWKGTPMPTTFVNGSELLAAVTAPLIATAGTAAITVQSGGGTSAPVALAINASSVFSVNSQTVTKSVPSSTGCSLPPASPSFAMSDTVYLYFTARVTTSNALSSDWLAPNGTVVMGDSWPPTTGNFCFPDSSLLLGSVLFNPIGAWQARVFDHGSLLFAVPFSVTVSGNQTTALAHAADGNAFKTTVLISNAGFGPAPYTLRFNDDHGNIPSSRFELETGSLIGVIPAGSSVTIRTAGLGNQTVNGWAELTAPSSVGGSVIYSQKTALPSIQEGTATIVASGSKHFFMPFDNTAGAITGVAVTNPGTSAANAISVTFRYSDNSSEVLSYPQLPSRNHQALVLAGQFPHTANRSGVAEFTSDTALSVAVFRFNSTGAFTALDAVPAGTSAAVVTRPLAHAADGNAFKTTVLLTNADSAPASYTLRFNDDHGSIPSERFELEAGSLTGVIPAGGSVTIRTAGLGSQTVNGWAELTAPGSVGGSVIYSQKTNLPSLQEGTATIAASGSQHFFMPFDNTGGATTGVAITNPGALGANITVMARFSDGTSKVIPFSQLASRNHQAFVLAAQFPDTVNRSGVVEFTSTSALSVVEFRFNATGAFTSFGIVAQ